MKVSKEEVATLNGVKKHRSSEDSLVDNEVASSTLGLGYFTPEITGPEIRSGKYFKTQS
ncbi:27819_t:CDS:2 [Dentiscutata erythropus]|uniref:27819_t:CDS:1 n=1 Tax=Dentiscutata erythropus TaxID=1348616 RepID=A0A9N9G4Q9_9GLOM|nr:27819_t:CDS:2 [Dentiscutata erythropus]